MCIHTYIYKFTLYDTLLQHVTLDDTLLQHEMGHSRRHPILACFLYTPPDYSM